MKVKPLHIRISNPCSQDWDGMTAEAPGKHCKQCNKVVYDFTNMPDASVIKFFKENKSVHCGRFHETQLNRNINPIKEINFYNKYFSKIAALVFSVSSFKSFAANSIGKKQNNVEIKENIFIKTKTENDSLYISGNVKTKDGPLKSAEIKLDNGITTETDVAGNFKINISSTKENSFNIFISYGHTLVTAVRSYHKAMGNTSYDILLEEPASGRGIIMGGISDNTNWDSDNPPLFPSLTFKKNATKLNDDHKAMLHDNAIKMKQNPNGTISIKGFSPSETRTPNIFLARLKNAIKYLNEKEGIAIDRMIYKVSVGENSTINTVNILAEN